MTSSKARFQQLKTLNLSQTHNLNQSNPQLDIESQHQLQREKNRQLAYQKSNTSKTIHFGKKVTTPPVSVLFKGISNFLKKKDTTPKPTKLISRKNQQKEVKFDLSEDSQNVSINKQNEITVIENFDLFNPDSVFDAKGGTL